MVINCESCNAELEVPDSLADGQPVRCPYCHCRFIYAPRGCEETSGGEDAGQSSAEQTPVDGSAELWAFVFRLGRHVLSSWVSAWKSMFDFGGRMPRRDYLEFVVFQFFMVEVVCFLLGKCGIFFLEHNLDFSSIRRSSSIGLCCSPLSRQLFGAFMTRTEVGGYSCFFPHSCYGRIVCPLD